MHNGRGVTLQILADGLIRFSQECAGLGGLNESEVVGEWERIPIQEIATSSGAVKRSLISSKDQTREGIPGVADASEIAPGASGVASMHSDAVAVDTARRFADGFFARPAAQITQHKLIGRKRDGLANRSGRKAFSQRGSGGFSRLLGSGFENGLAKLLHPGIFRRPSTAGVP